MEATCPYAIKNQRGASKIPPNGGILSSKASMPELVLYGIRLLAKQFLGSILDIEVDQSDRCNVNLNYTSLYIYICLNKVI